MIYGIIGALVVGIVGVFAIVIVEGVTAPLTNPNGTTTATTSLASVGVPLQPTNVIPWLVVETVLFCGLIAMWYFYHYRRRMNVQK